MPLIVSTSVLQSFLPPYPAPGLPKGATRRREPIFRTSCLTEDSDGVNGQRTLGAASYSDNAAMTDESCIAFCSSKNYVYAGTEYSSQCCQLLSHASRCLG